MCFCDPKHIVLLGMKGCTGDLTKFLGKSKQIYLQELSDERAEHGRDTLHCRKLLIIANTNPCFVLHFTFVTSS